MKPMERVSVWRVAHGIVCTVMHDNGFPGTVTVSNVRMLKDRTVKGKASAKYKGEVVNYLFVIVNGKVSMKKAAA